MLLLLLGCAPTPATTDTDKPADCEPQTWYADSDSDGYGDEARTKSACEAPDGYVDQAGDCDDSSTPAHPGGSERCNDVDDDCDGEIDEDATDPATWYADADGDGYGGAEHVACDAAEGEITQGGDCDDNNTAIHPGVEEVCDSVDQDCDGAVDDEATDASPWYTDADGDGYGAGTATRSCTQPDGMVDHGGDCEDTDPAINPDAEEVCNKIDDDCNGPVDDNASDATTWYTDSDHDGYGTGGHVACNKAGSETDVPGDCNDHDAGVNPAATEVCDSRNVDEDCDGVAEEAGADGETSWYGDADLDGYGDDTTSVVACDAGGGAAAVGGDCDDTRPDVNPGEDERCDPEDIDEDCDGTAEGPDAADQQAWYTDADGDGYGDDVTGRRACDGTEDEVDNGDDCDDTDATVNPGATEVCDDAHIDQNCDGSNSDADAIDAHVYYRDNDEDGWGSTYSISRCSLPSGYVEVSGDCDDSHAEANPEGVEVCDDDDIDEDCDGLADDADPEVDAPSWFLDDDGDGYGAGISLGVTCEAVAGAAPADGDCDDTDVDWHPGAPDPCMDGLDQDCDGADRECGITEDLALEAADGVVYGVADEGIGYGLGLVGDITGDGVGDLVVGVEWSTATVDDDGYAYVIPGPVYGAGAVADVAAYRITGVEDSQHLGGAVTPVGDMTGDGLDDVVISAPWQDGYTGAVYLFAGPITADGTSDDAYASFTPAEAPEGLGQEIAPPIDANDDGARDWLIGQSGSSGFDDPNMGYLQYGPVAGAVDLEYADVSFYLPYGTTAIGTDLEWAGDVDGDGVEDVVVGSDNVDEPGDSAGQVWLMSGPFDGTVYIDEAADSTWTGAAYDELGGSVLGAGDVDGDGLAEVWATADQADEGGSSNGALYLLAAGTEGAATDVAIGRWLGPTSSSRAYAFTEVEPAGDVDADGYEDLVATASGTDDAWVMYGPWTTGTHTLDDEAPRITSPVGVSLGYYVARGGDLDADGYDDLAFADPSDDTWGIDAGTVFLFYGGPR